MPKNSKPSGAFHKQKYSRSNRAQATHEGSTRFHCIGKVEFWMTALNRIFLIVGGEIVKPSLRGSSIVVYDASFVPTAPVAAKVKELLMKQRQIREGWLTPEEEKEAWTYN